MGIGEINNQFYGNTFSYNNMQKVRKETEGKKAETDNKKEKVDAFERKTKVETYDLSKLSKEAQSYLKQLKEKYGDIDIMVADYKTEEEAQQYLAMGKKTYSAVIDPELLEKMAADEETRTKYEGILESVPKQFEDMKKELGEDADKVVSFGVSIDNSGKVNYFAILDEQRIQNKKMQEENDKKTEEKKAEEKTEAKKKEQQKQAVKQKELSMVKADSIQDLIEKIKASKSGVEDIGSFLYAKTAAEEQQKGASIDFSL